MTSAGSPDDLPDEAVPAGLVVWGRVTGPDDAALTGATLTLTDLAGRQLSRSHADDRGNYWLVAPSGGAFLLICASALFQPTASLVNVGDVAVRHDVVLSAATRVQGRVRGLGEGQPLAEAFVTLIDVQGQVVGSAMTGADGNYLLDDLLAGQYTLTATANRHLPRSFSVSLPGSSTVTVDVELVGSGQVAGVVTVAATGQPLPAAMVTVVDSDGVVVAHGVTDSAGAYHFADLAPGGYTVTSSGYAPVAAHAQVAGGRVATTDLTLGHGASRHHDEPAGRLGG